jgi:hypothetical protein
MVSQAQADEDLGLSAHLVTEGDAQFFRAERATILFGRTGDDKYRKLCQLTFHKKTGALYAQFTYFRSDPGVVGQVKPSIGPDGSSTISWNEGGKVSTKLVKYSHPPDGNAHFSQDGSHQTKFWNKSLDLRSDEGHLFEIHAFHLEPFEFLEKDEVPKRGRLYLPFLAGGLPRGVTVTVELRSLSSLPASTRDPRPFGPVGHFIRRRDGKSFRAALLAPPAQSPLRNKVLLINVHPLEPPASVTTPMLLFMGGWERNVSFAPGAAPSFLSFTYPALGDPTKVLERLGSADLPNSPVAG